MGRRLDRRSAGQVRPDPRARRRGRQLLRINHFGIWLLPARIVNILGGKLVLGLLAWAQFKKEAENDSA